MATWTSITRISVVMALALGLSLFCSSAGAIEIKTLSSRADLVSGGDALVEIVLPQGADASLLHVDIDGNDVSAAFAQRANGRVMGLVTAMSNGPHLLRAQLGGSGASLSIVNHWVIS